MGIFSGEATLPFSVVAFFLFIIFLLSELVIILKGESLLLMQQILTINNCHNFEGINCLQR